MRNRDQHVKVSAEIPADYKGQRLEAWNGLSFNWLEHTQRDSFHRQSIQKMVSEVNSLVRKSGLRGASLIDLGCGPGLFLQELTHDNVFQHLVGVDFCTNMITVAEKTFSGGGLEFRRIDLENPLGGSDSDLEHRFQIATALFLFDEVADPVACFKAAARFLSPGGYLVVAALSPERERQRYPGIKNVVAKADQPILVSKRMRVGGRRVPFPYYRLIRSREALIEAARSGGFDKIDEQRVTAADLGSRSRGPFLRSLTFQRLP